MSDARQMHLMAFMRPVSLHPGGWRYPGAVADANIDFPTLRDAAQKLERACFDAVFIADTIGILDAPDSVMQAVDTLASFEPFTLLGAIASVTERVGLVATASTTFEEPFNLARRFASLDRISNGRAGWNIVTTWMPEAVRNFGLDEQPPHELRYERAREFYDVVTGLWDSFEDEAFVADVGRGAYIDPAKLHVLGHRGKHFSVRGPMNAPRPIQGWPVIIQAGASDTGRQFAADVSEVIFGSAPTIAAGQTFREEIQRLMREGGRDPDLLRVLPGAMMIVGETMQEAQAKRALLDSLVPYEIGVLNLSSLLGHDISQADPDGPLPEMPESNAIKSAQAWILQEARAKAMTVRETANWVKGYRRGLTMVGTASSIADEMEAWYTQGACDGFNVMFTDMPASLDAFVEGVVPELQRRGLFRTAYEGITLRDHLRLPRPANRYTATR